MWDIESKKRNEKYNRLTYGHTSNVANYQTVRPQRKSSPFSKQKKIIVEIWHGKTLPFYETKTDPIRMYICVYRYRLLKYDFLFVIMLYWFRIPDHFSFFI